VKIVLENVSHFPLTWSFSALGCEKSDDNEFLLLKSLSIILQMVWRLHRGLVSLTDFDAENQMITCDFPSADDNALPVLRSLAILMQMVWRLHRGLVLDVAYIFLYGDG
jgi:hypothetical protein